MAGIATVLPWLGRLSALVYEKEPTVLPRKVRRLNIDGDVIIGFRSGDSGKSTTARTRPKGFAHGGRYSGKASEKWRR
jgi:hypothetical protein